MRKYYSRSYTFFLNISSSLFLLSTIIPLCIINNIDIIIKKFMVIFLLLTIFWAISSFLYLFYTFSIDNNGIVFYFGNRIIALFSWNDIESVTVDIARLKVYTLKVGNKYYYIDGTKKISEIIDMYIPYILFQN